MNYILMIIEFQLDYAKYESFISSLENIFLSRLTSRIHIHIYIRISQLLFLTLVSSTVSLSPSHTSQPMEGQTGAVGVI